MLAQLGPVPVLGITQLLVNRLELLAQVHLALALAQLFLNLRLDVFLCVGHGDLALDVHQHAPQPVFHGQRLEQRLTVRRLEIEVAGDEVRELARLVHRGENLLYHLLRKPALLLARFLVERLEQRIGGVERRHFLEVPDDRLDGPLALLVVQHRDAPLPLQDELHAAQAALHLADLGHGPDRVEVRRGHVIHILALRDGEDLAALFLQRALDRSQRARPPNADGRRGAGKQHQLPQRQHRKGHTFSHAALAFLRVG